MSEPRVCVLADVQNLYYTSRQSYGRNFDYNRFWAAVTNERHMVKAFAYAIERGDDKQHQFQNILRAIGFDVKLKPYIQRADGSAKGDWDVGITIDAMTWAKEVDVLVLASGDGDFALLAETLRQQFNIRVEVYGVPQLTAKALVDAASLFVPIEDNLLL